MQNCSFCSSIHGRATHIKRGIVPANTSTARHSVATAAFLGKPAHKCRRYNLPTDNSSLIVLKCQNVSTLQVLVKRCFVGICRQGDKLLRCNFNTPIALFNINSSPEMPRWHTVQRWRILHSDAGERLLYFSIIIEMGDIFLHYKSND